MMSYELRNPERLLTPALLIYPEAVGANIRATLQMMDGDANRWRPHVKTAKLAYTMRRMVSVGIRTFKCATTLELTAACEAGAEDVLVAFPVVGANARRVRDLARRFPNVRTSVLNESAEQAAAWTDTNIGIFIDVNPGMDRTGISQERAAEINRLAACIGRQLRGLHYYDGHVATESEAHAGYARLLGIAEGCAPNELITSGTPAAPFALSYAGFRNRSFVHRVSPGTVVYNDMSSLRQLSGMGYQPAALVLATVISHPARGIFTCDAGHKSVSADAGVPTCEVLGHPTWKPLKPSEEHLPIAVAEGEELPAIGGHVYLLARHVCPTVNNFDHAALIADGEVQCIENVTARGHERPLPQ